MTTATCEVNAEIAEYQQVYSCFHKEAYGYRPRVDTSTWTLEYWREVWADLSRVCEDNRKHEAEGEARAIAEFEGEIIPALIAKGASDRATAIRWLADAEETGEDRSYFCYCYGLPYEYASKL